MIWIQIDSCMSGIFPPYMLYPICATPYVPHCTCDTLYMCHSVYVLHSIWANWMYNFECQKSNLKRTRYKQKIRKKKKFNFNLNSNSSSTLGSKFKKIPSPNSKISSRDQHPRYVEISRSETMSSIKLKKNRVQVEFKFRINSSWSWSSKSKYFQSQKVKVKSHPETNTLDM